MQQRVKRVRRRRKRKYSAYKVAMAIALALFLILLGRKAYDFYVIHEQIVQAEETKAKLEQEQKELEEKKQELNDPNVIGKKARDELGLVKPGEVPYVP